MLREARIDGGAAGAHFAAQHVGQVVHQLEVLLRTHAVAAGDDDAGTLDVDLALLDLTIDDLHHEVRVLDEFLPVDRLHLAGARFGGELLAHHALADRRHLGTVVGVDDRGDDVAAEGGTDLIKKVLVLLARLGVLVVADLQLRAVGRQAAVQRRRYAGCEVAAHGRSAEECDLGFLLFDQPAQHGRMGQRAERGEEFVIGGPHRVGAVFGQLGGDTRQFVTQHDGFEFHPEAVGQLAALGQQFEAHIGDLAALHLDVYEYIVHLRSVLTERVARNKFNHQ